MAYTQATREQQEQAFKRAWDDMQSDEDKGEKVAVLVIPPVRPIVAHPATPSKPKTLSEQNRRDQMDDETLADDGSVLNKVKRFLQTDVTGDRSDPDYEPDRVERRDQRQKLNAIKSSGGKR